MQAAVGAFLLGFPALFSIVNPVSAGLIFREVTSELSRGDRAVLARRVALFSFIVMMTALWAGPFVLAFFGISLGALRVAGGLLVAMAGWDLLNTPERREANRRAYATSAEREDMAFYPLTMPLTTGPGTISVAVSLGSSHPAPGAGLIWFFAGMSAAAAAMAAILLFMFSFADLPRCGRSARPADVSSHAFSPSSCFASACRS